MSADFRLKLRERIFFVIYWIEEFVQPVDNTWGINKHRIRCLQFLNLFRKKLVSKIKLVNAFFFSHWVNDISLSLIWRPRMSVESKSSRSNTDQKEKKSFEVKRADVLRKESQGIFFLKIFFFFFNYTKIKQKNAKPAIFTSKNQFVTITLEF